MGKMLAYWNLSLWNHFNIITYDQETGFIVFIRFYNACFLRGMKEW